MRQGSKHTINRTTTQVGATVSGDNVSLSAGNNLLAQASTIEAQGNASLQAGGELQLTTADNEDYHYEKSKSSGTFKSKTTEIEQRDVTAQGTTITAGGNVSLASPLQKKRCLRHRFFSAAPSWLCGKEKAPGGYGSDRGAKGLRTRHPLREVAGGEYT